MVTDIASAKANIQNIYGAEYIPQRNNYRLPCTHLLCVGANFHKQKKNYERIFNLSVYNAYNAMNPGDLCQSVGLRATAAHRNVSLLQNQVFHQIHVVAHFGFVINRKLTEKLINTVLYKFLKLNSLSLTKRTQIKPKNELGLVWISLVRNKL